MKLKFQRGKEKESLCTSCGNLKRIASGKYECDKILPIIFNTVRMLNCTYYNKNWDIETFECLSCKVIFDLEKGKEQECPMCGGTELFFKYRKQLGIHRMKY